MIKSWIKIPSFLKMKKLQNLQFPAQQHFSAWAMNCQESNSRLRRNFLPPWPMSQTLRWTNAICTCIWNHSVLQHGERSFSNGRNSISLYFFSQNPMCQFILFQYTYVQLCAKCSDLKPTIDENWRPQSWTCFWARCRNKRFHKKIALLSRPNVS